MLNRRNILKVDLPYLSKTGYNNILDILWQRAGYTKYRGGFLNA